MDLSNVPGVALLSLFVGYVFLFFFFIIGLYVYRSFAYYTIARKLKHPFPWLAWIPFGRTALILDMGGFPWQLVFLYILFIIGLVPLLVLKTYGAFVFLYFLTILGVLLVLLLMTISTWRFYEARGHPGWLSLFRIGAVLPLIYLIAAPIDLLALGVVAWVDKKKKRKRK